MLTSGFSSEQCAVSRFPEHQKFSQKTDRDGGEKVHNGVLFHENRGGTNQNGCDDHKNFHPAGSFIFVEPDRCNADGIGAVERGAYAGVGIHGVNKSKELGKHVIVDENLRPQILTIGVDDINDHGHNLCNDDVFLQVLKVFGVVEHEIKQGYHNQNVPEYVRNQKIFAERNQVVQWTVDHMATLGGDQVFGQDIGSKIENPSQQPFQMGKAGVVESG